MVFDEENGIAYEGYNAELIRAFLILTHYTDMDVSEFDTPQGRYDLYDIIASHGLWKEIMEIVDDDMADVDGIIFDLQNAARRSFERKHSLEYRAGKVFESLLGTENLAETLAKAEGLNSKLIDMMGAFGHKQAGNSGIGNGVMQFAKKTK